MSEAEDRLDQVFLNAFETNHPAMLDWVAIKFELKELRAAKKRGAVANGLTTAKAQNFPLDCVGIPSDSDRGKLSRI